MILDRFWLFVLFFVFFVFFGVAETVSIADSDAQRSVSPLRVRKQRDEV